MKIEKKFQEDFEMTELQMRKEKLKKIREMKGKPLNKTEIIEHEKRYETVVRKRMGKYNNIIITFLIAELEEERMRKVANVDYDPTKFNNKINQKVLEEDQKKRKELLNRINHKRLLAEKKMSYGEFVSQVHKPVVSVKKKQEMESLIEKVHHPIKETK